MALMRTWPRGDFRMNGAELTSCVGPGGFFKVLGHDLIWGQRIRSGSSEILWIETTGSRSGKGNRPWLPWGFIWITICPG